MDDPADLADPADPAAHSRDAAAPLELLELELADAAARAEYLAAWNAAWPEFAMNDAEFLLEVEVGGPARRWTVRRAAAGPDGADAVGTVAVERSPWYGDDAPPLAMAVLPSGHATPDAYATLLAPCAQFARAEGFDELRVLAWDREQVLVEQLLELPGWSEVEREVDVGLDLEGAQLPERQLPEGYSIVTLAQRPDLEPQLYACLAAVLPDIPGDEVATPIPFEDWLRWRRSDVCRDDACFAVLAPGGEEVAAFAELEFPAMLERQAWHGFTAVARAHRGRGLAFVLKLETIRWARANGFDRLRTENEQRNEPIRHINRVLGYAPLAHRLILRGPVEGLSLGDATRTG